MAWYRTGTVGVTNGSPAVTLTGGNALTNIFPGDTFWGPDGEPYEIAAISSETTFTLATDYQGPTATGQPYAIQPTGSTGALRLLYEQVSTLVTHYQTGRDAWAAAAAGTLKGRKSAGAGDVEDLSPADVLALLTAGPAAATLTGAEVLPALQEGNGVNVTALRLVNEVLAALGVYVDASGRLGIGTSTFDGAGDRRLQVGGSNTASQLLAKSNTTHLALYASSGTDAYISVPTGSAMHLGHGPADGSAFSDGIVLDANGNLLVGVPSGSTHYIDKSGAAVGTRFLVLGGRVGFDKVDGSNWSASATAMVIGNNTTTSRSINAAGTINTNGADYAEYVLKAWYCSALNPGAICGINADGLLTDRFDDAHTFVIKSTNPAVVGNDTWAQAVGPRPERPALDLPAYTGPERPVDGDPDYAAKMAAWEAAQADHAAAIEAARAAHATAMQQYEADLADFEARLEAERVKWDRIAFSGQVPVNVTGALPGQYIDAAPGPDGGIIGVPVEAPGPRTVGKVWKILPDGRAWVAVIIG
ncbi:hypothetical protein [Pedomonas sp. V897]|uniref:hypothetical protein n=1 Tax=Pedomonas sp. V897 TaxID=3446482 RepID=UPI003EE1FEF7